MKQLLFSLILTFLSVIAFSVAQAQETTQPLQPYWVIESNVNTPRQSTVYFYTARHELMYKEQVEGKKLNVNRRKIVKRLNEALNETVIAWQKEKAVKVNEYILAKRL
jgi:hypothetical protein